MASSTANTVETDVPVGSGSPTQAMVGFLIAAGWLLGAAVTAFFLAVEAEQKPLEEVAGPLSAEDAAGAAAGAR